MPLRKKKISELPLADSLKGLYTIGYKIIDGIKTSVKVSLEDIQTAYQDIVNAIKKSEEATRNANNAAVTANEKASLANTAAANANDTAEHPTYIGTDHYVYKWNKTAQAYDKTDIYTKGDAFSIKKVYVSVAEMEADKGNPDIAEGDFALVNTGDVEDPDNAKLYVKAAGDYEFLVDMSGAIGFTGKTPQFSMGTVTTLEAGVSAIVTVSDDGTDDGGNPKYKINFAIPRGNPGAPFRISGEYATLEALKSAVPDGSAVDGFMAVGTEAPYDYYAWVNGEWVSQGKIGGIDEAPTDGKAYGRKNGNWAEVSEKKYVNDSISSARSVGYMMQLTEIDASGLDENTWYPVTIAAGERENIRVEVLVALDSGTKPSWSTHDRGFSTRKIWEFAPSAWGVNRDSNITIYLSDFVHADIDPVRGLGNLSQFVVCYVFVRGGGKYHFYASHNAYVTLRTDTYKPSGGTQSVSPTTETPAEIVADIVKKKYADNIGYGKVINADSETISNDLIGKGLNLTGVDAEERVNRYFGNLSNFRSVVQDIIENHTRYFIHNSNDCRELGCLNTWKNTGNTEHELHFILTGFGDGSLHTKRYSIRITENTDDARFIIVNIISSDNLTTITKKTAAEYDAIGSKDEGTMYAITDV
jgi:hypothetical protein